MDLLRSRRISFANSGPFGSPQVYTIKMGVLILIGTDGKVNLDRYGNIPRAIEPIYSDLDFIFIVQPTRERERVWRAQQFAL